ncbi:MAG TPA: thiamine pyrophosphate-binding protein, partial [Caulobacteraceae bacterium]|nr:thiamine pyrophosphate-binding protein [Caulobacteraceae bacterium]
MTIERLTGGEAIVRGLLDQGVDTVFALPGVQTYGLMDALKLAERRIRTIGARHEQGVGYMAFGYAKASGRPGVCSVVPGPGLLNASGALLTAWGATTPVLCLAGQIATSSIGKERLTLHEMRDQLLVMRQVTKWAERIGTPGAAPGLVAEAFRQMRSGRPGPAGLEMPWEVFTQRGPVTPQPPLEPIAAPEPDSDKIEQAAKLLRAAKTPMVFVGGGALDASVEITALCEALQAPAVPWRSGRGIVDERHPLGFTCASGARVWPECDVALIIGTRFELLDMRWRWRPPGVKLIRIDIDPEEARRLPVDLFIAADATAGARALLAALNREDATVGDRAERLADAKAATASDIQAIQPQLAYLEAIRDVLPEDGILVDEISQMGFASWYGFPAYAPRTTISAGSQGTLGSGFPSALGAKAAFPDRAVVSVTGDGGFLFAATELATAVQYGLNVVTLVFNNRAYGNVRRDQIEGFQGRVIASDLVNPDFVKFAESFGVQGLRAKTPGELRR